MLEEVIYINKLCIAFGTVKVCIIFIYMVLTGLFIREELSTVETLEHSFPTAYFNMTLIFNKTAECHDITLAAL